MISIIALILSGCANQVALTGGPRDEEPPQIDTAKSITNYQTHFEKQDIELYFNEFVDLQNPNEQIVISPPLSNPPTISNRLKQVKIAFAEEEVLKEDATYLINFGQAIRDYTEGNKLENYSFVFSTGAYIDSLVISGEVINAKTREPMEETLVMLYDQFADSIIYKEKPFYFARTDEQGKFEIQNIRADTFKVMALVDENLNYIYDLSTEQIGFLDTLIILSDTALSGINLQVFKENKSPNYQSFEALNQGKLSLKFESVPEMSDIQVMDSMIYLIEQEPESVEVILWYKPRGKRKMSFLVPRNDQIDTITARVNTRNTDTLAFRIDVIKSSEESSTGLHPQDSLILTFDRPLAALREDQIYVVDTSAMDTLLVSFRDQSLPSSKLILDASWQASTDYLLTAYPSAFTDFFGRSNDTISWNISVGTNDDFGMMDLSFTSLDSFTYIVRLKKEDNLIRAESVDSTASDLLFVSLAPGEYSLEIIRDENDNGVWDPGNYLLGKQSERIFTKDLEDLRANWTLKEIIDIVQLTQKELSSKPEDSIEEE